MESTARQLRQTFLPLYRALYPNDVRDLMECSTTQHILRFNSTMTEYHESYGKLKQLADQVTKYQIRKELSVGNLNEYRKSTMNAHLLQSEYHRRTLLSTKMLDKIQDLPLLERARSTSAAQWTLPLATSTYALLVEYFRLSQRLPLWTLLQTKCTLQIEDRDPLPYTPACHALDSTVSNTKEGPLLTAAVDEDSAGTTTNLKINQFTKVNWGVPTLRPETQHANEIIPFPKYHLEEEYETEKDASRDKRLVQFNRHMLIHGFRRLDALERKRDYQLLSPLAQKRARRGETPTISAADPVEASILLTTLSASSAPVSLMQDTSKSSNYNGGELSSDIPSVPSVWEEPGVGICCAKASHFGESVAAGCDDAAVRIYNQSAGSIGGGEPCQVLLGHKEGFPVFDVDWNRDGRSLLTAGGDGTIRLWDTMAVGPFGELTTPKDDPPPPANQTGKGGDKKKNQKGQQTKVQKENTEDLNDTTTDLVVPGWRGATEPVTYTSGAALSVYRTQHSDAAVWSVSFAPCGYYFCSASADASARLWTTDRPEAVRLFSGHTSANVNCVAWHPNANYVVTGCDDKTARLWDIHTGQTVRLLSGCGAGINNVRISPGGRYCAGSDYSGVVHLWDLGSGRKMSILSPMESSSADLSAFVRDQTTIHSMSFSACGDTLAVGSDDCCVRIWDIRKASTSAIDIQQSLRTTPVKSFPTRRTVVMDLQYTRRNLLMAVGKYMSPVPLVTPIENQ